MPEPGEVAWRLEALERKVEEGFHRIDNRFESLQGDVRSLGFVSKELYLSEQAAQDARIEAVRTITMWTLGLLITAIIGAIAAGVVRLAVA